MQELEKQGIIDYMGHINNVPQIMAQSHIIVHPSYHEGLSNVLLEAAACGRPVLASNVPGCRETLKKDESGFLFEAKSGTELTSAIERILRLSQEDRKQMGMQGRRHVETYFDRNIVIEIYVNEINKVIEGER